MTELLHESAVVQLTTGRSKLVIPGREELLASLSQDTSTPAGSRPDDLLYTTVQDMPSLEALLAENRIATAVLYKSPPTSGPPWGPMAAAGIAVSVTVVGILLFGLALTGSTRPNPTYSFGLLLGGLGLLATTIAAAKHADRG